MSDIPKPPNYTLEIRSVISVGVGDGKLLLEVETSPDVFLNLNFQWRDFASIYEYVTSETEKQSAEVPEVKE